MTKKWIKQSDGYEFYDNEAIMGIKIRKKISEDNYLVTHFWFSVPSQIRTEYFANSKDIKNGQSRNFDMKGNISGTTYYIDNKKVSYQDYKKCIVKKRFSQKDLEIKNKKLSLFQILKQTLKNFYER